MLFRSVTGVQTCALPIYFNKLVVDDDEYYAVNSLWINGKVIVPEGFPKTEQKIRDCGYEVILINTSEFEKITGSLTCMSLRF